LITISLLRIYTDIICAITPLTLLLIFAVEMVITPLMPLRRHL